MKKRILSRLLVLALLLTLPCVAPPRARATDPTCTVTFYANGGTGTMANQTWTGETGVLNKNAFTRTGYSFDHWDTAANDSGKDYADQATVYSIDASAGKLTLYAQWKPTASYTVTFHANGGTGTMSAQTVTAGTATALTKNAFAYSGRTFSHWNTSANGSGTRYTDGQSVTLNGNLNLYAIWSPYVAYHSDIDSYEYIQMVPSGSAATLSPSKLSVEGCEFLCWNTARNGSGKDYYKGDSVTLTENLDLYAQWHQNTYTVYFDPNGGEGDMDPQDFTCGEYHTLRRNKFENGNQRFYGWARSPEGSVKYDDGESVKNLCTEDGDSITLYAVWRSGSSNSNANLNLLRGRTNYGSTTRRLGETYRFYNKSGVYNLVTESGGKTCTTLVKSSGSEVTGVADIPDASINSILTVRAGMPEIVVGQLDAAAYDYRQKNSRVTLELTVEKKNESSSNSQHKAIREASGSNASLDFYDFTLSRTLGGSTDKNFSGELERNLDIYLPRSNYTGKNVIVYRWHDGSVQTLKQGLTLNGEYVSVDGDWVVIHARRFSTYAVGYTDENPLEELTQTINNTVTNTGVSGCRHDSSCPISTYYVDASPNAWYHDGVHWALSQGVMKGYSAHCFGPDDKVTRASLVTMLWRLEGSPYSGRDLSFRDVPSDAWYATAVRWATGAGIINGRTGNVFEPGDTLTREELATVLYRHASRTKDTSSDDLLFLPSFSDLSEVSGWAYDAVNWMAMNGVFEGTLTSSGSRVLNPRWAATRAETAEVLMRYWKYYQS